MSTSVPFISSDNIYTYIYYLPRTEKYYLLLKEEGKEKYPSYFISSSTSVFRNNIDVPIERNY
jgi:hypothetical protein